MIILRNVLLTANGLFLLLAIPIIRSGDQMGWVPVVIVMTYLVLDFVYLSLTYPRRGFWRYVALLSESEPPLSD